MGSFAVQNLTETYAGNYTFCSVGYVHNYKSDENILISSGNKSKTILPEDSFFQYSFWD